MEHDFWIERWRQGRIGFHRPDVNPNLQALSAELPPAPARVLVPLCGKSLDMPYLAELGHTVVGVELSPLAVQAFFETLGEAPTPEAAGGFTRFAAGGIEVLQGDILGLDGSHGQFDAVWDRAALIALPPQMRDDYVTTIAQRMPRGATYLLVTMDIPGRGEDGPPFSIDEAQVRARYAPHFDVARVDRHPIDDRDDPFHGADELRFVMRRR